MRTDPRHSWTQLIAVMVFVACVVALIHMSVGCGPNTRRTTLATELATLNTARDVFVGWDKGYQASIVDKALAEGVTKDEVTRRIQAYRATIQLAVMCAFAYAYDQIRTAASDDKKPMPNATADVVRGIGELKPGNDPPADLFEQHAKCDLLMLIAKEEL